MESRTVKIATGDPYGDGHGRSETAHVKISGESISDSDLVQAQKNFEKDSGLSMSKVLKDLDSNYSVLDQETYDILESFGLKKMNPDVNPLCYLSVEGFKTEFSLIDLLMLFAGYQIENFSYEVVETEYPTLIGLNDSILDNNNELLMYEYYL